MVDICTKDSLRELATPGLLAVLTPIAVGFAFGYAPLGSYLAGAIAAGALMAVFLANSGGAWDNAKKLVEDGHYGGKGSDAHAATVIGDTVGDPFKDTAGPGDQPADQGHEPGIAAGRDQRGQVRPQRRPAHRRGARRGVIVVAAIVISKRRSTSIAAGTRCGAAAAAVGPGPSAETGGGERPEAAAGRGASRRPARRRGRGETAAGTPRLRAA